MALRTSPPPPTACRKANGHLSRERRTGLEGNRRQDRNNDGSECSAFEEERRAAGDDSLWEGTKQSSNRSEETNGRERPCHRPREATKTPHLKSGDEVDQASHKASWK
ncbi:hypothetical protein HPB50_000786 [Hyalomma asiaticum]|uniref:Uncharacterized protein n=1 Tax=Hyalomma asiaticum TaxID=266040 RepID=A0ACB7TCU1_HYAAI|nr:hypothetical protein HPB50_000786 [Hyalomma asiaticum]